MTVPYFTPTNDRLFGPLPRKDILAVCAFLNRSRSPRRLEECRVAAEQLDRLAAAARMQ